MIVKARQLPPIRLRPSPDGPRCALCSTVIGKQHRHMVDVQQQSLACACHGCHDLPPAERFRAVPDRYLEFPGDGLDDESWEDLRIPAGPAFLSRAGDRLVACCPGPSGAVEATLPPSVWERLVGRHPAFATLRPDVEALLVRRMGGSFLVPIDACYELAGALRTSWRGYDGAWSAQSSLATFFARLQGRCAASA